MTDLLNADSSPNDFVDPGVDQSIVPPVLGGDTTIWDRVAGVLAGGAAGLIIPIPGSVILGGLIGGYFGFSGIATPVTQAAAPDTMSWSDIGYMALQIGVAAAAAGAIAYLVVNNVGGLVAGAVLGAIAAGEYFIISNTTSWWKKLLMVLGGIALAIIAGAYLFDIKGSNIVNLVHPRNSGTIGNFKEGFSFAKQVDKEAAARSSISFDQGLKLGKYFDIDAD